MERSTVNVQAAIDAGKVSWFQWFVIVSCFLVVTVDGFDTAMIGFMAPAIRQQWGLDPVHLAPLFGAGLFGLAIGALIFGPLADRVGRKPVLIFSVFFFGTASFVSAFAGDMNTLVFWRFLTGLGLGGAMPTAITMTAEFLPQRRRSGLVTLMFCGFTLGSALGGVMTAQLMPHIGWPGLFIMGGICPWLLIGVLVFLPESPRYRVMRHHPLEKITVVMRRITGESYVGVTAFVTGEAKVGHSAVAALFHRGLLPITLCLWSAFFMSLLIVYLMSSWLPTLLNNTGIDLKHASIVTAGFQIGGTIGAIVLGQLMDRFSPYRVLGASYAIGAVFIGMLGYIGADLVVMFLVVMITGICVSGGQVGLNALTASLYPTHCRATGVSWSNAIGRCGAIVGSLSGGLMLSWNLGFGVMFLFVAFPAVVAACAITILRSTAAHHGGTASAVA